VHWTGVSRGGSRALISAAPAGSHFAVGESVRWAPPDRLPMVGGQVWGIIGGHTSLARQGPELVFIGKEYFGCALRGVGADGRNQTGRVKEASKE
jgi:hypothetical protein